MTKDPESFFKIEIPKEKYNSIATKYNFRKEEFIVDYNATEWLNPVDILDNELPKILDCFSVNHPRFKYSYNIKLIKKFENNDIISYDVTSSSWPRHENLSYNFEGIALIYSNHLEKLYNKNDVFFLHLNFLPIMDYFFKSDEEINIPLSNSKLLDFKEYIKFQIPKCYENIINENNVKILLVVTYEPFHHEKNFDWNFFYNLNNLLPEKFVLLTSEGRSTTQKHIPTMYSCFSSHILKNRTYKADIENKKEKILKKIKHKWHGLSLNRVTKPHRLLMCYYFYKELNSKIDYSMGLVIANQSWNDATIEEKNSRIHHWEWLLENLYKDKNEPLSDSYIQNISEIKKWIFDHGEKFAENENTIMAYDDKNSNMFVSSYLNSYFNIIHETYYYKTDQYTTFLTEKTFKAIMFFQPFIIVGQPNSIELLRELGFDVFDDYIDHGYDTLEFFIDRIYYVQSEITRLCNISLNEWTEILYKIYPRLLKNFNLFNDYFVNQKNFNAGRYKFNNCTKPKKFETIYYKNNKFHITDIGKII